MIRRSIVLKLWLAVMALFVVVLVPVGLTLNSMFTRYHDEQTSRPLREHVTMLARMVSRDPHAVASIPMMAADAEVEWGLLGQDDSFVRASSAVLPLLDAPALRQLQNQGVVTGEVEFRGAPYTVAAAKITGQELTGLVMFTDASPAKATLRRMRELLLLGGFGAILLATGLAFWLSKVLTRPLIEMQRATRAITRGDVAEVTVRTQDELGELGRAINELSGHLYRLERNRREFVAHVAHELKTPLSYIRGFSQAVAEGFSQSQEQQARYQQTIYRESVRLSDLVEDLLDLTQLEEGRFTLEKHQVLVREVLEEVLLKVQPIAQGKEISLRVRTPDPQIYVVADPARLMQVLLNLVDNALKHTGTGGAVELCAQPDDHGVLIQVRDTGAGIPPEELPLIWERFHKVDRSRSGSGRGLGLAIVRQIVKAHGGRVSAASQPGEGTTISVWLP